MRGRRAGMRGSYTWKAQSRCIDEMASIREMCWPAQAKARMQPRGSFQSSLSVVGICADSLHGRPSFAPAWYLSRQGPPSLSNVVLPP